MAADTSKFSASDAFDMLIAPLSPEEFFRDFYEQKYYRSPAKHDGVGDLLSIDRIDEIIADSELPMSSVSMAKSGQGIDAAEFTFDNGNVDRGAVLDGFRDGATIILPQLHFADGKLYEFCLALERAFGARTQTNIYMTPPGEHGFGIHYDDHDVFVLQVSGAKEWEIYGDRESLPYRGEGFRADRDDVGDLKDKFLLEEGQCLYVPRGTAHRALTHGDQPSLHITVGILVQTWADFMLEAVAEASLRIPELRHSLPRGLYFEESEREAHKAEFHRLAKAIGDTASFEATLATFSANFVREQGGRVRGGLNTLCAPIGADDRFTVRDNILYSFEDLTDDGKAEKQIVLAGTSIPLSDALAQQLQARITEGSLAKSDFDVEDAEELEDIVGTLVAYGLLVKS
ncbi:cupin domain-containing protein [Aurantiacibacter gangjinensis]|uniref:cupin domain-containing protein n=1 Tax=Aurantiacibacter gangjinensis TaxID=502682 RepID=UPI00069B99CA|nr:cupin domain-containing protein [Aurantiacibacter gangjinensis]APE26990.1 myc induced nuclear antigen [Aurantiacibacter gangjinensis]